MDNAGRDSRTNFSDSPLPPYCMYCGVHLLIHQRQLVRYLRMANQSTAALVSGSSVILAWTGLTE